MNPPVAKFRGVTFSYPGAERPALDGIDLSIARGEFVGVIGATGAGKSTLLSAFNGIVPQFHGGTIRGDVVVAGLDAVETPTSRLAAHVAMVLEDPETQITASTVEAEVAFALENRAVPSAAIRARVTASLAAVGLAGFERKHPAHLSGGQKQRLSVAAAIAQGPDVIVLDEPTSQLDPVATRDVFALLKRLAGEGATVVVASHASEELAEAADRILLLAEGRVAADGPPAAVFSRLPLLMEHHVRPPDITQAFAVLERAQETWSRFSARNARSETNGGTLGEHVTDHALAGEPLPVTLAAARELAPRLAGVRLAARPADDAAPAGEPVLEARDLVHVYPDGTEALRGVGLSVGRGEFVGIVGANGSGKSTLVRHFLNLLSPTSGTVRAGGVDVAGLSVAKLARKIGYVAQNAHQQIFADRVAEEVAFALRLQRRPAAEIAAAVDRALAAMELGALADRHPMSLSRGDRLRTVIAAVLALEPEILIFDEPTTGQDFRGALAILGILKRLNAAGRTVVVITHHLYLLPGVVDRLLVMAGGRIVADGPLRDILYAPETLAEAGLRPPQTVEFAAEIPALAALRPLGPADLARAIARKGRAA